jgi:hypothetical protein
MSRVTRPHWGRKNGDRSLTRTRLPTFLATHAKDLVSVDFFTVATVRFEILVSGSGRSGGCSGN